MKILSQLTIPGFVALTAALFTTAGFQSVSAQNCNSGSYGYSNNNYNYDAGYSSYSNGYSGGCSDSNSYGNAYDGPGEVVYQQTPQYATSSQSDFDRLVFVIRNYLAKMMGSSSCSANCSGCNSCDKTYTQKRTVQTNRNANRDQSRNRGRYGKQTRQVTTPQASSSSCASGT